MPPTSRRIGAHLPLGGGMVKAADRAGEIGADAIQVFSDNPTTWRRRMSPPDELPAFRHRLELLGVAPLAIHASYLVNLAGPDESFFEKSVGLLAHELRTADLYGARFVNVHIGSHRGSGPEAGARHLADAVGQAFDAAGDEGRTAMLVLENSAGGGFGLGATVDELVQVLEAVEHRHLPAHRIGLCLDTAHLWSAGVRLNEPDELDAFLADVAARIGTERVVMVHLNDSKSELGSHTDRHQHVGAGRIGPGGMRSVLVHPLLAHATYYLETPGMDQGYDAVNIARARELIAGRPLDDLPSEALEMRGSRSRGGPRVDGE
ncbi:MAG TPA: deoxyribonuclease IV [Candidatus Saccharimonadales bacterium]|nr:deoxyribonuclease IV [Candidatus Saccharimonadales bacterium]